MKSKKRSKQIGEISELLILPTGKILVHNLTPDFVALLSRLNPDCKEIASRLIQHSTSNNHELPN
jgi:hypothetical protein